MLGQLVRYAAALGKAWFALMSTALFTFIAIYAAYSNRTNNWVVSASAVAALFAFVVATFAAWRDEYVGRVSSEQLLQSQLPDFEVGIGQAIAAHYSGPNVTTIILAVEVLNRGADSPALRWEAHYVSQSLDANATVVHPGAVGMKLLVNGATMTLTGNDLIQAKVLPTVPRGTLVTGRMVLELPGDRAAEIGAQQATIVVSCEDCNHRRYAAYFDPSKGDAKIELLLHETLG